MTMNRFSRLIVLICIYAALFMGCFLLITYYNGVYLLENSLYQLFIAIPSLIIAVILIIVQFVYKKKGSVDELEEEDYETLSDEEIDEYVLSDKEIEDDNYEFTDSSELEFIGIDDEDATDETDEVIEEKEIDIKENEIEYEIIVEDDEIISEEKPQDVIDVLYDTLSMKKLRETENVEEKAEESVQQEIVEEEIQPEKEEVHLEKVSQDVITEDVAVSVDLTNTQMMYIEQSESSYLNTQGVPQLVVTDQVDSKDLKKANYIYKEIEKQKIDEQSELEQEELEFLKEEKEENIISLLTMIIVALVIGNIVLLVYYLFTRM